MTEIEVFIVCHDEKIIIEQESSKKYTNIPLYRYIFVGNGSISLLEQFGEKVIIARNLPDNIEQHKNLVASTAWYAVYKNNLVRTPYISMLEYDNVLSEHFYFANITTLLKQPQSMIGYIIWPVLSSIYADATPFLQSSFQKVYGINTFKLLSEYVQKTGKSFWSSTSNLTLDVKTFNEYMQWFLPIIEYLIECDNPLVAHVQERTFKIFNVLHPAVKSIFLPNVLRHIQLKSHKIEALI